MSFLSPEFLITSLIVVASPGTGAVYTVAAGLGRGAKASVLAAFACTLGILPHMAAAITGLAALLHQSALAFEIVKYAGVAYLLWMAWSSLREDGILRVEGSSPEDGTSGRADRRGGDQPPEPEALDLLPRLLAFLPHHNSSCWSSP